MQIADVNVLVCAFREDTEHHGLCLDWLNDQLGGVSQLGFSELGLSGVLRVLTHPRVFDPPTPLELAGAYVQSLLRQPKALSVRPGDSHWRIFSHLCEQSGARGNRIPDAYHAALAIEHGCEWVTLDRGFAMFPGLTVVHLDMA